MSFVNVLLPRRYALARADDAQIVWLDGNELLTPARNKLQVPTAALAQALAAEWNAQGKTIDPARMPLSQLAMTAVDRVCPQRDAVIDSLLQYLSTELICHESDVADLRALQHERWQAVRGWLQTVYGVTLPATTGLSPVNCDTAWARAALQAMDDWRLTATQQAAALLGSLAIALALQAGALTADEAADAAEVEGDFQAQRWGVEEEAETRRASLLQDVRGLATFIDLLKET